MSAKVHAIQTASEEQAFESDLKLAVGAARFIESQAGKAIRAEAEARQGLRNMEAQVYGQFTHERGLAEGVSLTLRHELAQANAQLAQARHAEHTWTANSHQEMTSDKEPMEQLRKHALKYQEKIQNHLSQRKEMEMNTEYVIADLKKKNVDLGRAVS